MNSNEEEIIKIIKDYVRENNIMPSMRYLQNKLHYKSVNSINNYYKSLENKGYLKRNSLNKIVLSNIENIYAKHIKIINMSNKYIDVFLDKKKNYLAYKLNNNHFKKRNILKGDLLIIEKTTNLKKNNLGLFIIDNKYRIMNYEYKDGFYILKDNESIMLNHVKLIGKVIRIIRKL